MGVPNHELLPVMYNDTFIEVTLRVSGNGYDIMLAQQVYHTAYNVYRIPSAIYQKLPKAMNIEYPLIEGVIL